MKRIKNKFNVNKTLNRNLNKKFEKKILILIYVKPNLVFSHFW